MSFNKSFINVLLVITIMAASMLISCTSQSTSQPVYDPLKNYAAFLVLNNPNSAKTLDNVIALTLANSYEIGPVEYYSAGTTDFEPVIRELTPGKQITLLWIVGNLMDAPNIRKGITKVAFKGEVRYMPVTGPSVP